MVEVTKRDDRQFPVNVKFPSTRTQRLTLKCAQELHKNLGDAIKSAKNAEYVRKITNENDY